MNQKEIDKLNLLCSEYHVTKTQMIRSFINRIVPPAPNKYADELISQLRRIGNNINQIVRSANSGKEIDTLAYKENVDMLNGVIVEIKEAISRPSAVIEVEITNGNN